MNVGLRSRTFKHSGPKWTSVDTTVKEKAANYPTESKFLNCSRERLIRLCQEREVVLRHVNVYAHTRQFRRMRGQVKKLRTYLGRVVQDIERKTELTPILQAKFADKLSLAHRLLE